MWKKGLSKDIVAALKLSQKVLSSVKLCLYGISSCLIELLNLLSDNVQRKEVKIERIVEFFEQKLEQLQELYIGYVDFFFFL